MNLAIQTKINTAFNTTWPMQITCHIHRLYTRTQSFILVLSNYTLYISPFPIYVTYNKKFSWYITSMNQGKINITITKVFQIK